MSEEKKPTFEDIRATVGKKSEYTIEIDGNMIRAYCQCTEDINTKWRDKAPPGLFTTAIMSGGSTALGIPVPYSRRVDAGGEWEFLKPITPGDIITTVHEFDDIQDKSSEKGPRALLVFKSTHTNQRGEVVAVSTGRLMSY